MSYEGQKGHNLLLWMTLWMTLWLFWWKMTPKWSQSSNYEWHEWNCEQQKGSQYCEWHIGSEGFLPGL